MYIGDRYSTFMLIREGRKIMAADGWKKMAQAEGSDGVTVPVTKSRTMMTEIAYSILSEWDEVSSRRRLPEQYKDCTMDELIAFAEFKQKFDPLAIRSVREDYRPMTDQRHRVTIYNNGTYKDEVIKDGKI